MPAFSIRKNVVQSVRPDWNAGIHSGTVPHGLNHKYDELERSDHVDLELVRDVLEEGVRLLERGDLDRTTTLDQWLAPRIHSALRISRRLAGHTGFWTWMVLEIGRPYTWKRWREKADRVTAYRYIGDFKRNSLSRLWWFAEMARNGPSYAPVADVLRDASTAQYAMELRYSMYRPAVIAFGQVARSHRLGFEQLRTLSKRINAYLSLRALEEVGFDEDGEPRDQDWWRFRPTIQELIAVDEITSARDGFARDEAVVDLAAWFESLIPEPVGSANTP